MPKKKVGKKRTGAWRQKNTRQRGEDAVISKGGEAAGQRGVLSVGGEWGKKVYLSKLYLLEDGSCKLKRKGGGSLRVNLFSAARTLKKNFRHPEKKKNKKTQKKKKKKEKNQKSSMSQCWGVKEGLIFVAGPGWLRWEEKT